MVRKVLADLKTQTRRLFEDAQYQRYYFPFEGDFDDDGWPLACHRTTGCLTRVTCRYGKPGGRLWIREAWRVERRGTDYFLDYKADPGSPEMRRTTHPNAGRYATPNMVWRPSIHLPRWASRIDLNFLKLRVERLQDISDADAIAEGIDKNWIGGDCPPEYADEWRNYNPLNADGFPCYTPRDSFASLWDTINVERAPWASNPWVWVLDFRRHADGADSLAAVSAVSADEADSTVSLTALSAIESA
jgi:hypothetical protein